ncbi:hypothetical protein AAFF_G00410700, partial [Aldrovandia affinis]
TKARKTSLLNWASEVLGKPAHPGLRDAQATAVLRSAEQITMDPAHALHPQVELLPSGRSRTCAHTAAAVSLQGARIRPPPPRGACDPLFTPPLLPWWRLAVLDAHVRAQSGRLVPLL